MPYGAYSEPIRYVGGVVGFVGNAAVEDCYNTGNITGEWNTAGVVGVVYGGTVENCYSTGGVKNHLINRFQVGGVTGYMSGSVKNCVALNPWLESDSNVWLVSVYVAGTLSNNYAFAEMKVNGNTVSDGTHSNNNGEDVNLDQVYEPAFWTTAGNWSKAPWDETVWVFEENMLPVLRDLPEQSGIGAEHLRRDIAGAAVDTTADYTYNGSTVEPVFIYNGKPLMKGRDYSYTTLEEDGYSNGTNAGIVKVRLSG